jgi:hypothetical protein
MLITEEMERPQPGAGLFIDLAARGLFGQFSRLNVPARQVPASFHQVRLQETIVGKGEDE